MSVKDACEWSHLSRTEGSASTINAAKLRPRMFVLMDSQRRFIADLPAGKFRS
jgi:hypothetical protein